MPALAPGCRPSMLTAPLDEPRARELADAFAVLADPVRLRLLSLIASQPGGEVCACQLAGPLGRAQPTVSHHLKVLFEAGLVDRQRRGTWIWYRVRPERLEPLRATLAASPRPTRPRTAPRPGAAPRPEVGSRGAAGRRTARPG